MSARAIVLALVLALLGGCGPDARQETACRALLDAIAEPPVSAEQATGADARIVIPFSDAAGGWHRLTCVFAGDRFSDERLALARAEIDDEAISELRLTLLRRALDLPAPLPPPPAAPAGTALPHLVQQL